MSEAYVTHEEGEKVIYHFWSANMTGAVPTGKLARRWADNIKIVLK
jgi:hypothetical protein